MKLTQLLKSSTVIDARVISTVTIKTPAKAGPTNLAVLTTTPFKLTAVVRSSGDTNRLMKTWRAGESTIWTNPPMTLIVTITGTVAFPSTARIHSTAARTPKMVWVSEYQQLPQIDAVGDGPAPRPQHQRRQTSHGQHQAQRGSRSGELQDEPADCCLFQE